jgi:two-component system, NarL family, sensor kinase
VASVIPAFNQTRIGLTKIKPLLGCRMGVIGVDAAGRILTVDASSAALLPWSASCIGQDWRWLFPQVESPALEFATAHPGKPIPIDVRVGDRNLRIRVHETEVGVLLIWHDRSDLSVPDRLAKAADRKANRTRYFAVRVGPGNVFTYDGFDSGCERATGLHTADTRGRTPHEILSRDLANRTIERYAHCVRSGNVIRYEDVLPMQRGNRRWKTTLVPVRDPDTGRIHRLVGRARDITDHAPAATGVEYLPGTLRSILNALTTQVLVLDSNGTVFALNAAWQANGATGLTPGTNYLAACDAGNAGHPASAELADRLRELLQGAPDEVRIDYPSGQRWFQLRATMLDISDGRFLVLVCEDVTEVRRCSEVLRQLPRKLIRIRDEERRKISRELHDSTAQNLVGASLATERVMRLGIKLPRKATEALNDARGLILLSLREIRTLSYLLHPPLLDDAGLAHALAWYVDGVARRGDLKLGFKVGHDIARRPFPREVEIALFRIAQEAIGNAHRHAGGTRIDVELALTLAEYGDAVVLTVADDGVGPSCAVMRALASSSCSQKALGVGLAGMRERLDELGGRLTVQPGITGGTVLRAVVPLLPASATSGLIMPRPIAITATMPWQSGWETGHESESTQIGR